MSCVSRVSVVVCVWYVWCVNVVVCECRVCECHCISVVVWVVVWMVVCECWVFECHCLSVVVCL